LMEGYGPSGEALVRLAEAGASLIVTVDCGAQAFEALDMAKAVGVDVIVVDHHKCASRLPDGFAIVNPNRLDESVEGAAQGHLAAVGMAFLLGAALLRTLRSRGWFADRAEPKLIELLDLVALGTVADVAQLRGLNRAFVTQGLKVMAGGRNIGLVALGRAARLNRAQECRDLGFALGPRINAGGRVGKSDLGVRLLTTEDPAEAEAIAAVLAAKDSGLLIAGGGHAMAAGLTVVGDRIDALADFLDERLAADVARSRDDRALLVDALLAPGGVSAAYCDAIAAGGPYGAGWPGPHVVPGPVSIVKADVVGNGHLRVIAAGGDGRRVKAIAL